VNSNRPGEISVTPTSAVQPLNGKAGFVVPKTLKLTPGVLEKLN